LGRHKDPHEWIGEVLACEEEREGVVRVLVFGGVGGVVGKKVGKGTMMISRGVVKEKEDKALSS